MTSGVRVELPGMKKDGAVVMGHSHNSTYTVKCGCGKFFDKNRESIVRILRSPKQYLRCNECYCASQAAASKARMNKDLALDS